MENMGELTVRQAEDGCRTWREWAGLRDVVVINALAAGVPKVRVHALTGIARTTIDSIEKSARKRQETES